jgi:signal transduction histidine kinase
VEAPNSDEHDFEQRLRRAKMDEAQHLAAELHDSVGQELAGISMMLHALSKMPRAQHPDIQEPLRNACRLMFVAVQNCRRISEGSGAFLVRREGLTAALRHWVARYNEESAKIEFTGRDIPASWLDATTAYDLFAIAREAICNALRHSYAKSIRVSCDHAEDTIQLRVADDGIGLHKAADRNLGIGLSIMEYRARSIGATLSFAEAPGGGLRVECVLQCRNC